MALGIPVSILGAILVLSLGGTSLNMISMFALIMALGLIVDDAIVVGENVYAEVERGSAPALAAVEGTRSVLLPVLGAVLTTWVAFLLSSSHHIAAESEKMKFVRRSASLLCLT